ncbi:MAG: hypothetical protein IIC79_00385 [Chloroflexi bacterium]|nr:hypothetical protein [Chloroflexota bacterium]
MKSRISIIILFVFLAWTVYSTGVWGAGVDTASYQDLIGKNFKLRNDLKALKNKFIDLEDKRKVLILHVKELQTIKNSRLKVIQNLKNMIASLREEMLKDPKLTKIIDSLNQKVKKIEKQWDLSQKKVVQFESEKKELEQKIKQMEVQVSFEKKQDESSNKNLVEIKKEVSLSLERITQLNKEKNDLMGKMEAMKLLSKEEQGRNRAAGNALREELARAQGSLDQQEGGLKTALLKIQEERMGFQKKHEEIKKDLQMTQAFLKAAEENLEKELEKTQRSLDQQGDGLKTALLKIQEERKGFQQKNEELKKDLQMAWVSLKTAEADLQKESAKVLNLKESLDRTQVLKKELEETRQVRDDQQAVNEKLIEELVKTQDSPEKQRNQLKTALQKALKEQASSQHKNEELEKEFRSAQIYLESTEANLQNELTKVQNLKEDFKNKTRELKEELEVARRSLLKTEKVIKDLKKKGGISSRLAKDIKRFEKEKSVLRKKLKKLDKDFQKADGKNQKLDEKISELTKQVHLGDKMNRQLMKDLKKEQESLARANKNLKKENLKSTFEREHYEEQLKFAKADQAMSEAKIHDLAQRALIAETRSGKVEEELKRETGRSLLKESEVIVLQEEKSKLEKK